jgi:hypothetical protein
MGKRDHHSSKKKHHHNSKKRKSSSSALSKIYKKFERFSTHHPIASVGLYLFVSLVLFRLALFDPSFRLYTHIDEIHFWIAVIAVIMVFVALLSVLAWWRRHVPDLHVKGTADMTWKNR